MEGAAEVVAKGVAAKVVVARARAAADWSIACALKALGSAAAASNSPNSRSTTSAMHCMTTNTTNAEKQNCPEALHLTRPHDG